MPTKRLLKIAVVEVLLIICFINSPLNTAFEAKGGLEKIETGVETTEVETTEVATTEVATTEVAITEVATTEVVTTKVATTKVETTEVATTEVETTEVATTEVETTEVATTEVATTEVATETETEEDSVNEYELYLLAHLISGEADSKNEEDMRGVAIVAMNRVASKNYPNSLEGVIYQSGQYACTGDGNFQREPSVKAWDIARAVLNGERFGWPSSVVFQAQFRQGRGTFKIVETRFGTHYYCSE